MSESRPITLQALQKKRVESLIVSKKAVADDPETYCRAKELVRHILNEAVDIGEYHDVATRLAQCLEKLTKTGPDTIFQYYLENIDPRRFGRARYLRVICRDLMDQFTEFDQWRRKTHGLKILDGSRTYFPPSKAALSDPED